MCGIAGLFDRIKWGDAEIAARVARMNATIVHRGPDGEGVWCDAEAGIGLGHRRLAIIDLSEHGRQPMVSASGRWVLSFNGEIYNFRDLRAELESQGVHFSGNSDSEVLLEACARWGVEKAVKRAAGMFAFALWDRVERRVWLARDRLGIKPLYWASVGNSFYWASELTAIEVVAGDRLRIDQNAVATVLRHGYIPAPLSIWREIHKLEPATLLSIDASGQIEVKPYWRLADAVSHGMADPIRDMDEGTEALDTLLKRVVSEHMISDVPLGAFLSGGIDSSLVTSIMQSLSSRKVKTFSIGFEKAELDEAPHARAVAKHLGTDHTELYVSEQDAIDVVGRLGRIYDEPFADSSQIPTFLVSQLARRDVTVALSGDGGDENFAGYTRYPRAMELNRMASRARMVAGVFAPVILKSADIGEANGSDRTGRRLRRIGRYLADTKEAEFYRNTLSQCLNGDAWVKDGDAGLLARYWPGIPASLDDGELSIAQMQYIDTLTYLPDDILVKVDRASMAVSLEARVPLLDHRVVELAWRMSPDLKWNAGVGKRVLREVLNRYVPKNLYERPKMGFGVPLDNWLTGPLKDWGASMLSKERLEEVGIVHPARVARYWDDLQAGRPHFSTILWSVLSLTTWYGERRGARANFADLERAAVAPSAFAKARGNTSFHRSK